MKYLNKNKINYLESGGGFDLLSKLGGLAGKGGGFNLDPSLLANAGSAAMQMIPESEATQQLSASRTATGRTMDRLGDQAFTMGAEAAGTAIGGPLGGAVGKLAAQGITKGSDALQSGASDCITDPVTGETVCKQGSGVGNRLRMGAGNALDPMNVVKRPLNTISNLAQGDVSGAVNSLTFGVLGKDREAEARYKEMQAQMDQRAKNQQFAVNPQQMIEKRRKLQYDAQQGFGTDFMYARKGGTLFSSFRKGGAIKRKDGSYSQRGLWDNIRANEGSGKKPTEQMLEQERKIKTKLKSGGNWLQKANKQMEKKGTVGAFTEYCGGKVTNDCIERGLNSPDSITRKRAQFAKTMRKI